MAKDKLELQQQLVECQNEKVKMMLYFFVCIDFLTNTLKLMDNDNGGLTNVKDIDVMYYYFFNFPVWRGGICEIGNQTVRGMFSSHFVFSYFLDTNKVSTHL